jgi:predicted HicB family RNase H-like nuclease
MPAPKNNQNAKKEDGQKSNRLINFRVPAEVAEEYKRKAEEKGVSLTTWIREKLSL